ncbi:MAG: HEPN domain-containing protein [Theionarchaea archaeon]|nr:MAG: hypothetical protein AYK19_21150 [Theionarchaea archaeon DG-70-1]MBU7025744.1 HEPN domain-containing protein [Theionarchaea archaeon]
MVELGKSCFKEVPIDIMEDLVYLNPHYTITRYVDASLGTPSDIYDETSAKEAIEKARKVREWIEKRMDRELIRTYGMSKMMLDLHKKS